MTDLPPDYRLLNCSACRAELSAPESWKRHARVLLKTGVVVPPMWGGGRTIGGRPLCSSCDGHARRAGRVNGFELGGGARSAGQREGLRKTKGG